MFDYLGPWDVIGGYPGAAQAGQVIETWIPVDPESGFVPVDPEVDLE